MLFTHFVKRVAFLSFHLCSISVLCFIGLVLLRVFIDTCSGNRVKSKKYGARILEVVAQTVNGHQSGGNETSFNGGNSSSPGERSAAAPKRPREVEDVGWKSTRKGVAVEMGANYADIENDFRMDSRHQTTKKAKQPDRCKCYYGKCKTLCIC